MKKTILVVASVLISANALLGQSRDVYESSLHVSFFPPLSTNGQQAALYSNKTTISLLAGISQNEQAAAFAGLANVILNDARGAQFAGLYNGIGQAGRGAAFAGLVNNSGSYRGLQSAGLLNATREESRGAAFAGLLNLSGDFTGAQFAGLGNIAKEMPRGSQFAGMFNVAEEIRGLQVAGLANIAGDMPSGSQFAGLFNIAQDMHGVQFAGLINVGGRVRGAQFAGLINIAQSSDCSIGFINIIGDGEMGVGIAYNEIGNVTATFRSGGRVVYGILGGGYNFQFNDGSVVLEGGLGARIYLSERWRINNELKSAYIGEFKSAETYHQSFSMMPAFRITPKVEIFAGPSLNFMHSDDPQLLKDFPSGTLWKKHGEKNIKQLHVGFSAGMYFGF